MGWGSGGGGFQKPQGGGNFRDTRSQAQEGGGQGGLSNHPGATENHPGWVNEGGEAGRCSLHPGGCANSRAGSVSRPWPLTPY